MENEHYEEDEYYDNYWNDLCVECWDNGTEEGCPKCGKYSWPKPQTIKGVKYYFATNVTKNDKLHQEYKKLREQKKIRVMFRKATDVWKNSLSNNVAIWPAVEDKEIARKAGLYV